MSHANYSTLGSKLDQGVSVHILVCHLQAEYGLVETVVVEGLEPG